MLRLATRAISFRQRWGSEVSPTAHSFTTTSKESSSKGMLRESATLNSVSASTPSCLAFSMEDLIISGLKSMPTTLAPKVLA